MKYFTDEMPCRSKEYGPIEKLARDLADGVDLDDYQPWIPPVKMPIMYPEEKNRVRVSRSIKGSAG